MVKHKFESQTAFVMATSTDGVIFGQIAVVTLWLKVACKKLTDRRKRKR